MNTNWSPRAVLLAATMGLSLTACTAAPAPTSDEVAAAERPVAPGASSSATTAGCPTASESLPINLLFWKTQRDLQDFIWSSDGAKILGIEHLYEEKQYWDPFFGIKTETRKDCYQLYWTVLGGGTRTNLGSPAPLQVTEAFAFPQAGYVVVHKHSGSSSWQIERVALDGTRRALASIDGSCDWARAIPSPDGALVAYAHSLATHCGDPMQSGSTTTVSFFDAAGKSIGGSGSVGLAGDAAATWTPAGQLVVTDGVTAATVALDGTVAAATIPHCTDPSTTSSEVDAAGRLLAINNGNPAVVATDPTRAFGCQ